MVPASVSCLLCSSVLSACLPVTRVTPPAYSEPGRSVSIHLPGTGLKARRDDRVRSAQWHRRRSTAVTLDVQRAIGNSRLLHSLSIQLRLINEKSLASFPVIRWNRKSMTQNRPAPRTRLYFLLHPSAFILFFGRPIMEHSDSISKAPFPRCYSTS